MRKLIISILFLGLSGTPASHAALNSSETMYVQSQNSDLKKEPRMDAETVAKLKRGTAVQSGDSKGLWVSVTTGKLRGWVHKFGLNSHKPKTEAELKQDLAVTGQARISRQRISNRSVTMGVRGLTAGNRAREGRDVYPSDYQAVDKINQKKVDEKELQTFKRNGSLPE